MQAEGAGLTDKALIHQFALARERLASPHGLIPYAVHVGAVQRQYQLLDAECQKRRLPVGPDGMYMEHPHAG